jgi:choline dehydrogenase-like flavoprotein
LIEDIGSLTGEARFEAELAVVGAGPAGIVTALEAADRGINVLLVESGQRGFDPAVQELSDAAVWDRKRHAPLSLAVRRQLGGTSVIWGGRCVPYDPVDFVSRPVAGSAVWPVGYEELQRYFARASDWLRCGRPVFSARGVPELAAGVVPGLEDDQLKSSDLERWSLPTDFGRVYGKRLLASPHVRVLTGVTTRSITSSSNSRRAEHLDCRTLAGGRVVVAAKHFVVACGGLESTRLLMTSTAPDGGQLGNGGGHLGRWYMAHVEGVAAKVRFSTPPRTTTYGFQRDVDGTYVRRRFTFTEQFQREIGLPNFAAWLTNPELADASHRRGELSFVYLALRSRLGPRFAPDAQRLSLIGIEVPGAPYGRTDISPRSRHVANLARHPVRSGRFVVSFGTRRFLRSGRRAPGYFSFSPDNVYPLQYHSEHLPNADSRVSLSDEVDAVGRPKLAIDLRFAAADVDGVVRAHEQLDARLRASGVGRLEYTSGDVTATVSDRLGGGFHQVGTTRMSRTETHGVVDENLRVFGVENVHVASSSTFVTSGQANSTFMIVVFALRLADRLCDVLGAGPRVG